MTYRQPPFSVLLAFALALPGCAGGGTEPVAPILHVALQDDLKSLDPAIGYDIPSWAAAHLLYNGLVTYDFDSQVVGDLAAAWTLDATGKIYTFTLRPGLIFHDGKPVTAKDVVYSFNRLLDPKTKSPGASFYTEIVGAATKLAGDKAPVTGVTALSDTSVKIELLRPNPVFLQLLAMPFTSVVPDGMASADLARKPIGTGPFAFGEWVSGQKMTFKKAATSHAKERYAIDGVEYLLGINENLEVLKFERGEIDVIGANRNIPAAEFPRLLADPKLAARTFKVPDAAFHYVGMNCTVAPFDKVEVRRAIAMAIDKERVIQLVNGRGQVAHGILPPTMPGYDKDLKGIPYDVEGAKALLAKAGHPKGFAATYYCVSNDTGRKVAQSIQQDLSKVGINLTLKPLAFPTFLEAKATKGQVGIAAGNWSQDFPDPSNFLTTMFHGKNIKETNSLNDSFYRNPAVDKLLDQADATTEMAARTKFFRAAEALVVADAPVVPLYNPVRYAMVSERVKGYRLHPIWGMALDGVTLQAK